MTLDDLRSILAEHLIDIEETLISLGKDVGAMADCLTLIARDPNEPEMFVVVSSDKNLKEVIKLLEQSADD